MTAASQVDLHLHTTCSDGTLSPEALAREAARRGLRVIAITDHDSVAGVAPAQVAGQALGLTVVPGIEASTELDGEEIHLLGYGFDFRSAAFLHALAGFQQARRVRNSQILERLRGLGCGVEAERVAALSGGETVSRPHIAAAMVEAGHVASIQEAFNRFLAQGKPAYVAGAAPPPGEVMAALREAGAIVSIAHPSKLRGKDTLRKLVEAGLRGIEVYHIDQTPTDVARFSALARELGLLETGGSDSHGPDSARPVEIGAVPVPEEVWERLEAELSGRASAGEPAPPRARA